MAKVKAKPTMKRTPLPNQRMATTKKPAIKSSNSKSIAKPQRFKMSAATRRIWLSDYTVESLGRKSGRGRDTPWIELPEPEALLYQDEKSVESYTHYLNSIHAVYAELFPDRTVPKSEKVISAGASSSYHRLCVIIEAENEAVALAEAIENPEFVFPEEEDDGDEDDNRALDGQAK
ncbi:uncharacterized protein EAE97_002228 [Botrytis byssoidea]|uniref:Uncharacterized protein n=1 Tax=Botrytis byssoidea TaxID=139641 RepID=A0A9P5M7E3_9HELO|nr:uncharacterized protein EAE97_002228 [Botrytis byssoidea]KAF7950676.1 hypothetical protein EAE97_002228 [Botrytis byssoidea]